jgi:hypothetical protein
VRLLADLRVSGWSSPRTRRQRMRVSSCSWRAASCWPRGEGEVAGSSQSIVVILAQPSAIQGHCPLQQREAGAGSPLVSKYMPAPSSSQETSLSARCGVRPVSVAARTWGSSCCQVGQVGGLS